MHFASADHDKVRTTVRSDEANHFQMAIGRYNIPSADRPMQRKTAQIWVCADKDFDLAKHPVASSHPDADGGGLDCTRTGIQQERVAGC